MLDLTTDVFREIFSSNIKNAGEVVLRNVSNGFYSVGTYFYVLAFFKNFAGGLIAVSDIFRLTHAACLVELRHYSTIIVVYAMTS